MNDSYKYHLGQVLSEKRRISNINKSQLSKMVGLSRLTIRKIEEGAANPTIDVLLRITQGIGVSFAEVSAEAERRLQLNADPHDFDAPYVLLEPDR